MCIATNFRGELNQNEFYELFSNQNILQRDINNQKDQKFLPPTIEEIAQIFEFLDEERSGMIKASNFMSFLELAERLKIANMDYK